MKNIVTGKVVGLYTIFEDPEVFSGTVVPLKLFFDLSREETNALFMKRAESKETSSDEVDE